MLGLGSLIGGAMKIGGSIFGGIKASQAMKQVQRNLEQQQRENEDWYNRRYNEDATQRADAQRMLTYTMDNIRRSNRAAAATQAVMGGTEESVAASKAANAQSLADAASQIAAAGASRKDAIENQFMNTKANLNQQLNNLQTQKANNIMQAVGGVSKAASGIAEGALNDIKIGK